MFNKRVKIKELLSWGPTEQEVTVMGWVRTFRNNQFIALNDGSTNNNLQVVVELGKFDEALLKRITTSASVKVTGIVIPSLGKGQKLEVKAKISYTIKKPAYIGIPAGNCSSAFPNQYIWFGVPCPTFTCVCCS